MYLAYRKPEDRYCVCLVDWSQWIGTVCILLIENQRIGTVCV